VASHFACLGIRVDSPEAFAQTLDPLVDMASPTEHPGHVHWVDPSGAAISFHLEQEQIACVTPFFAAPDEGCRWRVQTHEPLDDRDCPHCGGADCDLLDASGRLVTRTCVQWVDYRPYRAWLEQSRTFSLRVTLFSRVAHFYDSEAEFSAAKPFKESLAPMAFMPYGMFSSPDELVARASAIVTGPVLQAAVLHNQATGGRFVHVRMDTLAGPMDLVVAEGALPRVGGHAAVQGWLVGRPQLV
jgi:hypothetical protein